MKEEITEAQLEGGVTLQYRDLTPDQRREIRRALREQRYRTYLARQPNRHERRAAEAKRRLGK